MMNIFVIHIFKHKHDSGLSECKMYAFVDIVCRAMVAGEGPMQMGNRKNAAMTVFAIIFTKRLPTCSNQEQCIIVAKCLHTILVWLLVITKHASSVNLTLQQPTSRLISCVSHFGKS